MGFLKAAPDKDKVRDIVLAADLNEDGDVSPTEVKILFSRLLGIPEETIPVDHEEVVSFSKLTTEEMVDKLYAGSSKEQVDLFHHSLFPHGAAKVNTCLSRRCSPQKLASLMRPNPVAYAVQRFTGLAGAQAAPQRGQGAPHLGCDGLERRLSPLGSRGQDPLP